MAIDPGNIVSRRANLTIARDPDPTHQARERAAAARAVHRVALDDLDAAELIAMLGLDQHPERVLPLSGPQASKERRYPRRHDRGQGRTDH